MDYLLAGASFPLCLLLVPLAKYLSYLIGAVDEPSKGIHKVPTPRLGGIAVIGAVAISTLLLVANSLLSELRVGYSLLSLGLVFLLGLLDDCVDIRARLKMGAIIILVLPLALLYMPANLPLLLHILYSLLALVLFLGTINAVNFIDGMDGLAPGLCLLSFLFLFLLLSTVGDKRGALLALCCACSLLGFLFYNWHPASIFMGDGGNYALGFILAYLSYRLWLASPNIHTFFAILFLLFLPAYDLVLTVVRRLINHRGLFEGDLEHSYNKMLRRWGEYKKVVIFFLVCQAVACVFGIYIFTYRSLWLTLLLSLIGISSAFLFARRYELTSFEGMTLPERTKSE